MGVVLCGSSIIIVVASSANSQQLILAHVRHNKLDYLIVWVILRHNYIEY